MGFLEDHLGGGTWRADPPCSSVTFKVRHLGARDYRAGFREIDATLDPAPGAGLLSPENRVGVELSSVVDRRDFGLDWQEALPNGGDTLGWDVTLEALIEFVEQTG